MLARDAQPGDVVLDEEGQVYQAPAGKLTLIARNGRRA
jgi:hypothetical protein